MLNLRYAIILIFCTRSILATQIIPTTTEGQNHSTSEREVGDFVPRAKTRALTKAEADETVRVARILYPNLRAEKMKEWIERENLFLSTRQLNHDGSQSLLLNAIARRTAHLIEDAIDANLSEVTPDAGATIDSAAKSIEWASRIIGAGTNETKLREAFKLWAPRVVAPLGLVIWAGAIAGGSYVGDNEVFVSLRPYIRAGIVAPVVVALAMILGPPVDEWPLIRLIPNLFIRSTAKTLRAEYWYEIENLLTERSEWRDWVKGRNRQPGYEAIERDVIEFMVHLVNGKLLHEVCADRLADKI